MVVVTAPTRPLRLLRELDSPRSAFAYVTPNWFAAVMGTGIVGIAAAGLPVRVTGLRAFGTVLWALAAALLVVLALLTAGHWRLHRRTARGHADDPVLGHFYGAIPMALMTVGTGTLLLGRDLTGLPTAVGVDWCLWTAGTVGGLVTTVAVPARLRARGAYRRDEAFGGWLMPVVPPMVSAAAGALLAPHLPAGVARTAMVVTCYLLFAVSLVASALVIPLIVRRVRRVGAGPARTVPTLWIVLGPLGQSVTAAGLLGRVTGGVPARLGYAYGLVVWCLALGWAVVAATITARTVRAGMPFSLTWWSFTFPIGTCVTGTGVLAARSGGLVGDVLTVAAAVFFAVLVLAWARVAAQTFHGAVVRGYLLAPPVA